MIIAPIGWNHCPGTVSTSSDAFRLGYPAANLFTEDPRQRCIFRGLTTVTAGTDDKSDYTHSVDGAQTATLNAGDYYGAEFAIELARAHTATGGVSWTCHRLQSATTRHRYVLTPASGTASLQINTGTNAATNALRLLAGFRDADRSSAASHVGDLAQMHGTTEQVVTDLGSAVVGEASFVVGLDASPAANVSIGLGATSSASDTTITAQGYTDNETLLIQYLAADTVPYRYARLRVSDRYTEGGNIGVGYWYHGPVHDTDRGHDRVNYSTGSLSRSLRGQSPVVKSIDGHAKGSERRPGESISVSVEQSGMGSGQAPALAGVLEEIGAGGLCFVALDPVNDPHGSSMMARLTGFGVQSAAPSTVLGRFKVSMQFERVPVL